MSRRTRKGIRAAILAAAAVALCACASVPDRGPVQYVDRDTGVNYTLVSKPLIFAHLRPQIAARVRDYATVAAAFRDRNGQTEYVFLIYLWSTVDPRNEPGTAHSAADLALAADDRLIPLHALSDPAHRLPPLDRPPAPYFLAAMYGTDLSTLRYLTSARYLALLRDEGGAEARFELWDDERAALADFVTAAR